MLASMGVCAARKVGSAKHRKNLIKFFMLNILKMKALDAFNVLTKDRISKNDVSYAVLPDQF